MHVEGASAPLLVIRPYRGDASRMRPASEAVGARYRGCKIAEIENKLHG